MSYPFLQCLTLDTPALSHRHQVDELCRAGAKWIQLRMKQASDEEVEAVASDSLLQCRAVGCVLIINDRVDVARRVGADGVHLGKLDTPWAEARRSLGTAAIIGGTINSEADAQAAHACGVLDYVGVGPYRFTKTKKNIAPVLSIEDWRQILSQLRSIPAFAIGGIELDDLENIHLLKTYGLAISSALFREGNVSETLRKIHRNWEGTQKDDQ